MTETQQTESAERIARPLIQLAKLNGISTSYIDQLGTYVEIRDEVLVSVLAALGVDASSDEAIATSYELTKQRIADTLVEPTIVKFIGKESTTPIRAKGHDVTLRLLLEDGTQYEGNLCMYLTPQADGSLTFTLPDDIPAGYHTLRVNAGPLHGEARLICAPARVPLPPAIAEKQRWGWMAQMYSIRSAESWGVGDYGDLKLLLTDAAEKSHADFMLINPIHATAPVDPLEPSPYLPESRRFMNVTYIRPQDLTKRRRPRSSVCTPKWPPTTTTPTNSTSTPHGGTSVRHCSSCSRCHVPPNARPPSKRSRKRPALICVRSPHGRWHSRCGVLRGRAHGLRRRTVIRRKWPNSYAIMPIWSTSNAGCSGLQPNR